jgi:DNA-binding PadR family transcriptional regulator/GNAT superfamily N-acetyltransferase
MMILRTPVGGDAHGHTIAKVIERTPEDVLEVEQGSLHPAFHRLEDRRWVSSYWCASENNRRAKFYLRTAEGRKQLVRETSRSEPSSTGYTAIHASPSGLWARRAFRAVQAGCSQCFGNYNRLDVMIIRQPELSEHEAIHHFVRSVVNEVYGGLWSTSPIEIENQDWSGAWIACSGNEIVGLLLTKAEWIDDLWVRQDHRSKGLGTKLLQHGEAEVAGRNYEVSRLRVVKANRSAISFYIKNGWNIEKEVRHETLSIEMLELAKRFRSFT